MSSILLLYSQSSMEAVTCREIARADKSHSQGGNLPVDGAIFIEAVPPAHQYLLTLLSVFWAIGQVVASLISWVFIARYSCDSTLIGIDGYTCNAANNPGWRYACKFL